MNNKSNVILSKDFYIILAVAICLFFVKIFTHGIVISLGGDELLNRVSLMILFTFRVIIH